MSARNASENVPMREVAERLGVCLRVAYQAAERREIPGAFRVGRRWVVPRVSFEAALGSSEISSDLVPAGDEIQSVLDDLSTGVSPKATDR